MQQGEGQPSFQALSPPTPPSQAPLWFRSLNSVSLRSGTRDLRFSLDLPFLSGAGPFISLGLSSLICKMGSSDWVIL